LTLSFGKQAFHDDLVSDTATDGQAVALTAIRTCYSANKPSEIVAKEGAKYFGTKASDDGNGTEADRLIRHISNSGHLSTLEHLSFTFAIEGVSRALLAQLTRHRVGFSFSVQSQRYVKFGSDDRSGGFDYVIPESVKSKGIAIVSVFKASMEAVQQDYDILRDNGVPAEDARAVLPQAVACNLVVTANLRSLLDFYGKRNESTHAQGEIQSLAENLRKAVVEVEPWADALFEATKQSK
jgi:thymidylate synthase (FAD)